MTDICFIDCEINQWRSITKEVVFLECLELDLLLWCWCCCCECDLDLFTSSLECLCFWPWYWCLLGLPWWWCPWWCWCWPGLPWWCWWCCCCRPGLLWPWWWWTLAPGLLLLPLVCPCLGVTKVMSRCQILTYHVIDDRWEQTILYKTFSKVSNCSSEDENNGDTLFLPSR